MDYRLHNRARSMSKQPHSPVQPTQPNKLRRSRYYRMLHDLRYALVLNVICALLISYILNPGSNLGQNLIAAMCIGTIAFVLIDGARLTLWAPDQRPKAVPLILIVLVSVPVAQWLGMQLFTWLTKVQVKALTKLDSAEMVVNLVFTLGVTGAAILFFSSREKI